jgi:hypothetical protein
MISFSIEGANYAAEFAMSFILTGRVNIVCSLEGKLFFSDRLDDSRGADEESELGSVLNHHMLIGRHCQL